jgi:hypothetical protein
MVAGVSHDLPFLHDSSSGDLSAAPEIAQAGEASTLIVVSAEPLPHGFKIEPPSVPDSKRGHLTEPDEACEGSGSDCKIFGEFFWSQNLSESLQFFVHRSSPFTPTGLSRRQP